jgi:hypothetical protein
MIETEVLEAAADATTGGKRVNEIANQFRRGRDVTDLLALLDSSNAELVSIGAWILGEIDFNLYNDPSFISRLRALIQHANPSVRFHVFGAIYPALNPADPATIALVRKMRTDPDEGVRRSAEAAAARLSIT